uniref:Uncharacterized protein n=1 Tax=Physcomitrium patens TaxID=3218 RepID=A0A7I4DZ61_PHYPA
MALALHWSRSLQFGTCNAVSRDFLPVHESWFLRGSRRPVSVDSPASMRTLCIVPTTPSDLLKSSMNSSAHLSRIASGRFGIDYALACRHSPNLKVDRLLKKQRTVYEAAASSASSSSGAQGDFDCVTFLGREFLLKDVQFVSAAVATVLLACTNKILYKMALVPLSRYSLFLAQFNTFTYVVAYSSLLLMRYRAGIVTKEMLAIPKARFVMIGALEALGIAMSMSAAAVLPGATIPVLAQVFLVWQLLLSSTILRKRYTFGQVGGCLLVIAGVVVVVASGSGGVGVGTLQQSGYFWPIVMIVSTLFFAASSILKELVFRDGAKQLKGDWSDEDKY